MATVNWPNKHILWRVKFYSMLCRAGWQQPAFRRYTAISSSGSKRYARFIQDCSALKMKALHSFERTLITDHSTRGNTPYNRNIFLRLARTCHF
jgi:hypothetical protein